MNKRNHLFSEEGIVTDDSIIELSPLDDDYAYFESELESLTDPLSDDYCKYDNE